MAAPYNPPVKNQDFVFAVFLESMSVAGSFQVNPTIADGDFTVSKNFGTFTSLGTVPDAEPDSGSQVRVQLTADEMNADVVTIRWVDQSDPKEWADGAQVILTTAS